MTRLAAALLVVAGLVHAILGVSAMTGAARLEANVQEIEASQSGGDLYFSLGAWGVIAFLAGAFELCSAASLERGAPRGRLIALVAAFIATGVSFFSLPIFRWPNVLLIALLISATYVLAYQVRDAEDEPPGSG